MSNLAMFPCINFYNDEVAFDRTSYYKQIADVNHIGVEGVKHHGVTFHVDIYANSVDGFLAFLSISFENYLDDINKKPITYETTKPIRIYPSNGDIYNMPFSLNIKLLKLLKDMINSIDFQNVKFTEDYFKDQIKYYGKYKLKKSKNIDVDTSKLIYKELSYDKLLSNSIHTHFGGLPMLENKEICITEYESKQHYLECELTKYFKEDFNKKNVQGMYSENIERRFVCLPATEDKRCNSIYTKMALRTIDKVLLSMLKRPKTELKLTQCRYKDYKKYIVKSKFCIGEVSSSLFMMVCIDANKKLYLLIETLKIMNKKLEMISDNNIKTPVIRKIIPLCNLNDINSAKDDENTNYQKSLEYELMRQAYKHIDLLDLDEHSEGNIEDSELQDKVKNMNLTTLSLGTISVIKVLFNIKKPEIFIYNKFIINPCKVNFKELGINMFNSPFFYLQSKDDQILRVDLNKHTDVSTDKELMNKISYTALEKLFN